MKEQRGLTLIEVLIAMTIFALGVVIILSGFGSTLRVTRKSQQLTIATRLAQQEMEYLKNINFPPTTEDRESEFNKAKVVSPDNPEFEVEVISAAETGCEDAYGNDLLKKVMVNVYRAGESIPLVTLRTYMARNGI